MNSIGTKSVRELGGEIWAELEAERRRVPTQLASLDCETSIKLIDFIMSILARHINSKIVNDEDLPVAPLPRENRGE